VPSLRHRPRRRPPDFAPSSETQGGYVGQAASIGSQAWAMRTSGTYLTSGLNSPAHPESGVANQGRMSGAHLFRNSIHTWNHPLSPSGIFLILGTKLCQQRLFFDGNSQGVREQCADNNQDQTKPIESQKPNPGQSNQ